MTHGTKKKICLALQGGGAYGAFTWGILDRILEDGRFEIDSISATSAGSVNAVLLAYGMHLNGVQGARDCLYEFWHTLSEYGNLISPIQHYLPENLTDLDLIAQMTYLGFSIFTSIFSPYMFNPYNFTILRFILIQQINFNLLRKSKIKLFINATNVKTGRLKIFYNKDLTVDTIMASTSIPTLYQSVEIEGEYYWDGGFLGNPPIFPLIYDSEVDDIIIVHTNPIERNDIPMTSFEIINRMNEISFNSSLVRELRVINFLTELVEKESFKEEELIKKKLIHIIEADEVMNKFTLFIKYDFHWENIHYLYRCGQKLAEQWLAKNYDSIGVRSTININNYL